MSAKKCLGSLRIPPYEVPHVPMGDLVALHLSSTKARFLDPPGRRACRCGITARGVWSAVLSRRSSRSNAITPSVCAITSAANVLSRFSIGRGLAALSQAASNDSVDSLRDQGMCCKMNDVQYNLPRGQARFPGRRWRWTRTISLGSFAWCVV
jgi:hypothetical protein